MKDAGYKIYPHLYKFEEYGVPQARHRMIIVGIREDLPYEFKVPSPKPYDNIDNTCKTALECPPIPEDACNNELTKQSAKVVERLSYIKPGENAFTADLPEELKLKVKGAKISQNLQALRSVKTCLYCYRFRRWRYSYLSLFGEQSAYQQRTCKIANFP